MNGYFKAISISYKEAPLQIRGQVSLSEQEQGALLRNIKEVTEVSELLILSTCNRTEIYYSSEVSKSETIIKLLAIQKGFAQPQSLIQYCNIIEETQKATQHLFKVAIGLESQVVGDLQIINQVKKAYQLTADLDLAGPFLHRLLHSIFFTNKKVVQETPFRDGAASVAYAAVELVESLISEIDNPKVLVVGIGEIGTDTVKNLASSEVENIVITNRTFSKAENLAKECDVKAIPFENVWEEVKTADVVISSVAKSSPFFTKENVSASENFSYKYFIDLSVPSSVAPNINDLAGIVSYGIDEINSKASEALELRKQAIPQVEAIVQEAVNDFDTWTEEMVFSPAIQNLKKSLEKIRQEEISRFVKSMSDKELKNVDKITKGIMNKIIKMPVLQLKAACQRGEAENLVGVLNDLFNLEAVAEEVKK